MGSFWKKIVHSNHVDARALGLFRIVLGLILVVKFWGTVPRNFTEVFSPATGLLGNCFAEGYVKAYGSASPLFSLQSDASLWIFTLATGLVMVLFTIGFYPRLQAMLGSILLWLFNDRFQMLWFGWEQYAQVLLFLCIFVPVGERFSLFMPRNARIPSDSRRSGPLAFALLFQIAFIYFFNGISKNGEKWMDGTAVQFAMGAVDRQTSLSQWLIHQDFLGAVLTYGTLAWEILFPFLLFFPSRSPWVRGVVALSVPLFHWGLSLFMDVGDFKYVGLAVAVLLLPTAFWNRLPSVIGNLSQPRWKLPSIRWSPPAWVPTVVAILLVGCMVGANLNKSFHSRTPDRMKEWLGGGGFARFVSALMPDALPRFSFFTQHWHLFSPNPPSELGYIRVEVRHLDDGLVPVFAGEEGVTGMPTKTLRFLMQYLSYDRKNMKAEVFASCMASREAHLWHESHPGVQAKNVILALYTWRPESLEALKAGPEGQMQRVELISLKFKYDAPAP